MWASELYILWHAPNLPRDLLPENGQSRIICLHESESTSLPPTCRFAAALQPVAGAPCFMHAHACTEIIWYGGGRGWLQQDGARLAYAAGHVAVYQPGAEHGDCCHTAGLQVCVGVTGAGAADLRPGMWLADEATRVACERLREDVARHDAWRQERLNLACGALVLELRRQLAGQAVAAPRAPYHVTAARQLMATRFAEPLTIAQVAAELGIHADYLRQLFVQWVGEPPVRYLIRLRLAAACDLLRLNQEPTARIAQRVGIANPYYFSRLFRAQFGMTPTHYRTHFAEVLAAPPAARRRARRPTR